MAATNFLRVVRDASENTATTSAPTAATTRPSTAATAASPETALGADTVTRAPRVNVDESPVAEFNTPEDIDLEQLYPASAELNTTLSRGLILLGQGLHRLDRAIDYFRGGEAILADDQVGHLLVVLDELFCLRALSEGFANVVSACANGIRNLRGQMAEEKQLYALNSCLLALKKKPLISFDSSLEMIDRLEASGLDVDAAGTEIVVDWLSNEGAG